MNLLWIFALLAGPVTAQRISECKCREFAKKNIRVSVGVPLTLDPEPVYFTAPNCSDSIDLIVNGVEAGHGEFPHQAALGYVSNAEGNIGGYEYSCGGSLISDRFILTAAHCPKPHIVRLGVFDLTDARDGEFFDVAEFYRHEEYRLSANYYDIALVKLTRSASFTSYVRPACLWTNKALNISTVIASGYGSSDYAMTVTNRLMKVRLEIKDKNLCAKRFKFNYLFERGILDDQLCIGSQEDGKDTCQGDSGGPIQAVMDSRTCLYHIVGVTSTGISCGGGKANNVYTNVARYLSWIEPKVWPEGGKC